MVNAVYLHIPFCDYICHYCDFNKIFMQGQPVIDYLEHMDVEMKNTLDRFPTNKIDTIFVGGGTPTALSEEQLKKFLKDVQSRFGPYVTNELEFTMEANPGSVTPEKLRIMKTYGVNRLSIGAQAFQDSLLNRLGRGHSVEEIGEIVRMAQQEGFINLSLDLMFGLPDQTIDQFSESITKALELGITHVSSYSLQVEKKTVFYNQWRKGELPLPTEEAEADMYALLISRLEEAGLSQYEISNFAKEGFESKHNITYWKNDEYYGIGAGAHSYIDGVRRANAGPLKQYMNRIDENGFPYIDDNVLTKAERMEEEMFMGLRMREGVSKQRFEDKFGQPMFSVFGKQIENLTSKNLLQDTGTHISLTEKGFFLGNEVFQEFLAID
ncbi:radical SAM family heme chaperone HemW [Pseudalkalibacillus hwajinpoensis]|uniref:Heme chaperone HemW n=1 Tax=Guptibacillus hwajinpoensis TaxID=208199 RepID=A0A4U1MI94_9BACL|nr:radical SAM family heme chaperone HemW [Pseudalkalibacillus hwajinpoensis]TKD70186.1 oxygen-independent coproporphyrinogen III oxidase [Pseudalkalibacillus hwajinpoensis]